MPVMSVIMPVHNGMPTLDRAVSSVRQQTFSDWELLAIDDCSTDGTLEILRAWAADEPRIRVLRTPENSGPGAARNLGLRRAQGRLVAYLDADDEYLADYLAHVARLGEKGDVLLFAYDVVNDAGQHCTTTTWDPACGSAGVLSRDRHSRGLRQDAVAACAGGGVHGLQRGAIMGELTRGALAAR